MSWQEPHPLFTLDPSSGAVIASTTIPADGVSNQGLGFWGGYFYVFEGNVTYQYDPKTQQTEWLANNPLAVTGAGQSTCVPQTPPK